MIQVNVCHGWSCSLVTKCAISDFNHMRQPGTWTHHYQEPATGESCVNFEPVGKPRMRAWGAGAEAND
jgi:hypothetical protein